MVTLVGAVFVVYGYVVAAAFSYPEDRAAFGSSFGVLEALFTALAFFAVFHTLQLQREELKLQRRELMLTRRQVQQQTEIHEQRLALERKRVQPALVFKQVRSVIARVPRPEEKWTAGRVVLELENGGGPMFHADGRIWYSRGEFADLFPGDQDEDAVLTTKPPDVTEDIQHYIAANSPCFMTLPFGLYPGTNFNPETFRIEADIVVRYLNSHRAPRVSLYRLRVNVLESGSNGSLFLVEDMEPAEAKKRGLLDAAPMDPRFRDREAPVRLEDLYPELE